MDLVCKERGYTDWYLCTVYYYKPYSNFKNVLFLVKFLVVHLFLMQFSSQRQFIERNYALPNRKEGTKRKKISISDRLKLWNQILRIVLLCTS